VKKRKESRVKRGWVRVRVKRRLRKSSKKWKKRRVSEKEKGAER
jgi:hypothetical protein